MRISRFGQSGNAVLANDPLDTDTGGVAGRIQESEELVDVNDNGEMLESGDVVVDGGKAGDLNRTLIAPGKAREGYVLRDGEVEGDLSLLLLMKPISPSWWGCWSVVCGSGCLKYGPIR